MASNEIPSTGQWCCTDCLMLLANGDTPTEWTESEVTEWLARIEKNAENTTDATLGHLHDEFDGCSHYPEPCESDECDCEEIPFSSSSCGYCGSSLAGARHAFTWWLPADAAAQS